MGFQRAELDAPEHGGGDTVAGVPAKGHLVRRGQGDMLAALEVLALTGVHPLLSCPHDRSLDPDGGLGTRCMNPDRPVSCTRLDRCVDDRQFPRLQS